MSQEEKTSTIQIYFKDALEIVKQVLHSHYRKIMTVKIEKKKV